ncbi:MAG: GGDEF domain-containing protein, partial [Myxococcales bacterium]|nr:GGDEF domain-containing protein [Myxococcales bacterium]
GWLGWRRRQQERQDLLATAELEHSVERLREQTRTDPLTGLSNRMHVLGWLEEAWERSRTGKQHLSVLVVDIDRFKSINDRYGHPAGDEVIRQVARAIASSIRQGDLAGRWGGEEFVAVLWSCPQDSVHEVAERMRVAVESLRVCVPDIVETIRPTVSIGAATWCGDLEQLPHRLLAEADRALYAAKRQGRNRVSLRGEDRPAVGGLS